MEVSFIQTRHLPLNKFGVILRKQKEKRDVIKRKGRTCPEKKHYLHNGCLSLEAFSGISPADMKEIGHCSNVV